ncbi:MAG: putative deacylase [Cognaticolwellia sp.]
MLELVKRLPELLTSGTVILFPTLNPEGLSQRTREVPADGVDLNRSWPGDARGGPTERLAHAFWTEFMRHDPDLVIDLHTDSPASIPYCIVDRHLKGSQRLLKKTDVLAAATGLTVLREYPRVRYVKYQLERSLSGAVLNILAIPSLTIESGPRLYLDPSAVDTAVNSVLGVLTAAGLASSPAPPHPTRVDGGPWRRESGLRVGQAGVLITHTQPGEHFGRGQLLAEIVGLDGVQRERLLSPRKGVVVSLPERTWVVAGIAAGTYAVLEGD